ncbi:hypothetical protein EVG18_02935, partial [Burkholderia pyrrocinia]
SWSLHKIRGDSGLFNEAEALAPGADAAPAHEDESATQAASHACSKRGRKPLDPSLPRGHVTTQPVIGMMRDVLLES